MRLKYSLRDWQQTAFQRWQDNGRRGIIEVVTGGGKTVFAEACMADFLCDSPDGRVLIVVPTLALADQWALSLEEELGLHRDNICVAPGRATRNSSAVAFIVVINSARNLDISLLAPDDTWMLIVDECHRAGSQENQNALRGHYSATLGLSATPERQYDNALDDILVPTLGPIVYSYGLQEARRDGVITPFQLVNVRVDLLSDEQARYSKLSRAIAMKRTQGVARDSEDLKSLLMQRARVAANATMRIPVAAKIVEQHTGERAMVFHEDITAAKRIAGIVTERGGSVCMYHTGIGHAIRISNLRLYRRGVYNVMVSCRALDEGVNIPETTVAILAAASASERQRIQRLGRVLRPADGKDSATIYTLYATDLEEERLCTEAERLATTGTASVSWHRAGGISDG